MLGELELPGYSAYLHPIGSDLLLGIGQDVDDQGNEPTGTQLSLFDVSDLRHPTRLAHATLGQSWSEAESDHHAFLFWPPTGLVVVPFYQRAVGYRVDRAHGLQLVGRITQPAAANGAAITRSVVVGGSVFTISDAGVASNSLATLAPAGLGRVPGARAAAGADARPRAGQALKLANLVRLRRTRFERTGRTCARQAAKLANLVRLRRTRFERGDSRAWFGWAQFSIVTSVPIGV